jgi:hypothetical protein
MRHHRAADPAAMKLYHLAWQQMAMMRMKRRMKKKKRKTRCHPKCGRIAA